MAIKNYMPAGSAGMLDLSAHNARKLWTRVLQSALNVLGFRLSLLAAGGLSGLTIGRPAGLQTRPIAGSIDGLTAGASLAWIGLRLRRWACIFFLCMLPILMSLPVGSALYRLGLAVWHAMHTRPLLAADAERIDNDGRNAQTWLALPAQASLDTLDPVLKQLRQAHAHALFFVPLSLLQEQPDVMSQLARSGHRIGLWLPGTAEKSMVALWRAQRALVHANLLLSNQTYLSPSSSPLPAYISSALYLGDGEDRKVIDTVQVLKMPSSVSAVARADEVGSLFAADEPDLQSRLLHGADLLWPAVLIVFHSLVILVGLHGVLMLVFARRRRKNPVKPLTDTHGWPSLSVLVPAYNEEAVICATVRSLLANDYPGALEIIVINDGSKDATYRVVQSHFSHEQRVRLLTKPNGGKASALNLGLSRAEGRIVAVIDADTLLHPAALRHLAANFIHPDVAAVSGNMQVGNLISEWTRQQSIEYCCANNIERRAQEYLGCITVVPGAIGAYRRNVLRALGGYRQDTLAEDADLTVRILRNGWRVVYEEHALARTEAPHDLSSFMKQRFRWAFGKLQVLWKHRDAFFSTRSARLGWIGLPTMALFTFAVPLCSFLLGWMQFTALVLLCISPTWSSKLSLVASVPASLPVLLAESLGLWLLVLVSTIVSRRYDRGIAGSITVPIFGWQPLLRMFSGMPVRCLMKYVLILTVYRSLVRGQSGKVTHWNKLQRTGTVTAEFN